MINPGQAAGLGSCQFSQDGIGVDGPPSCPSNSKVGEVEVETPLLPRPAERTVYLLASNPPDIKLLVAPETPIEGHVREVRGTVHLNETTGQLVTTFEKTPQLPFDNLQAVLQRRRAGRAGDSDRVWHLHDHRPVRSLER